MFKPGQYVWHKGAECRIVRQTSARKPATQVRTPQDWTRYLILLPDARQIEVSESELTNHWRNWK